MAGPSMVVMKKCADEYKYESDILIKHKLFLSAKEVMEKHDLESHQCCLPVSP